MRFPRLVKEVRDVDCYDIDGPLFPVLPRPVQERMAPGLGLALWRWLVRGAMHRDEDASLSRHTGGRV